MVAEIAEEPTRFTMVAEIAEEPTRLCDSSRYTHSVHLLVNHIMASQR